MLEEDALVSNIHYLLILASGTNIQKISPIFTNRQQLQVTNIRHQNQRGPNWAWTKASPLCPRLPRKIVASMIANDGWVILTRYESNLMEYWLKFKMSSTGSKTLWLNLNIIIYSKSKFNMMATFFNIFPIYIFINYENPTPKSIIVSLFLMQQLANSSLYYLRNSMILKNI